MAEQEKRNELRQKLTEAVTDVMGHNDLDNQQQLEVLAEMFLNMMRLYGEFNGENPTSFAEQCLGQMITTNNPHTRWREMHGNGNKRGGRIVQPDENNSWLKVFPVPMTSNQMIDYLMLQMGHKFDAKQLPAKMQGVLLTSMPESDKEFFKLHLKTLGVTVVSKAVDHRLRYVVFGAGIQASSKTEQISDRIAHDELIDGIYYEEFYNVVNELEYLKESGE